MRGTQHTTRAGLVLAAAMVAAAACSSTRPIARHHWRSPVLTSRGTEVGTASWYGPGFHGRPTASGEIYDQNAKTAAHRTLPLGTRVRVTALGSGRSVVVRINDRGPYKKGRVLDLSRAAAAALGMVDKGTAEVEIRVLDNADAGWPTTYYSVQIGAFGQREQADRVGRAAARHGENAYLQTSDPRRGGHYRVRVGPFRDRHQAVLAAARLARSGFDPLVVEESSAAGRYLERRSSDLNGAENRPR